MAHDPHCPTFTADDLITQGIRDGALGFFMVNELIERDLRAETLCSKTVPVCAKPHLTLDEMIEQGLRNGTLFWATVNELVERDLRARPSAGIGGLDQTQRMVGGKVRRARASTTGGRPAATIEALGG